MSILRSMSRAIITTFDTVGDMGKAAQETVSMGTKAIHRKAIEMDLVGKEQSALNVAQSLRTIQSELENDEKLKTLFDEVSKHFD